MSDTGVQQWADWPSLSMSAFELSVVKLLRPLWPGTIGHPSLIERLARDDPCPVVSVVAPVGYGKTLLSQWAERNGQALTWVSVDEGHNDPKVLLAYTAEAPEKTALWLLADHMPGGCRLVLAGRAEPPLRVARLRAGCRILEIGPGDLSLTRKEAFSLLRAAEAALEFSIAAGDAGEAARLVEKLGVPTDRQGRVTTLRHWCRWLEDGGGIEGHPALAVEAALLAQVISRYISEDTWFDAGGKGFQPQVHYFAGGATKMYGAASPTQDAARPTGLRTDVGPTVTVDSHEPASPVPEPVQSLATAKFSVPQRHRGMVSRALLVATSRSSDCRVVAVIAPPGYGKSTFLAEWAAAEDRRVAWVSLDRLDDDPANLLVSLASAYCRAGLGDADLVNDMVGSGVSVLGRAAPRLAAEFRASPVPFVLMLDDLHELRSPTCHDVLSVLITAIPCGSQLVAASRSEQPHLCRLRASREALEFGADDLALGAPGARQIFANTRVSLTHEQAAAVTERTEGWPVGLCLAALVAKGGTARSRPSPVMTGTWPIICLARR